MTFYDHKMTILAYHTIRYDTIRYFSRLQYTEIYFIRTDPKNLAGYNMENSIFNITIKYYNTLYFIRHDPQPEAGLKILIHLMQRCFLHGVGSIPSTFLVQLDLGI